ncbi:AI-2E family transporter [Loktanella sp. F6476L]|uniref:AI-2E family transporter n=1 Tax=Loktanella sp. F6476L TaxID=2926405 RepID=UPI001FF62D76|nr:AI-2E family transporter [Loktanella sp. F6476L]MCK0119087.1 AI-2E family transporter [Loktanella sp. F6476L]
MALSVQQQTVYWGVATAVFCGVLWVLGDVIMPFILGGAIAYCLDPVADRLEKMGLSRVLSVTLITLAAFLIFILLVLLVIPTLVTQATALIEAAPDAPARLREFLTTNFPALLDEESTIYKQLLAIGETIQAKGGELISGLLSSAAGLLNVLVLLVVVPVVAFYLLLDWDNMVARIDDLIPLDHADTLRHLASEIDGTLASFIRGQGTVCLVMGTFYAVGLMSVGLNFGLVVGAFAGLITFIPYVGALVGGVLAIGLAIFQFWGEWGWMAAVAAVFALGQFLEGNIITPRLVGNSVGLHPVWLIFALSVFGALFGFVGMLVAVPVAAMIGVLIRFGITKYKESLLYRGKSGT